MTQNQVNQASSSSIINSALKQTNDQNAISNEDDLKLTDQDESN